ncbi:MAG: enoyl-CoA hydratase/isomerase family protein [Nocardioidaceae bacterium]
MSTDILKAHRDNGVGVLTVNRPDSLNAWDMAMQAELAEHLRELDGDDDTRAIVLTGAGDRAFCAGQDLAEAAAFSPEATEGWLANFQAFYEAVLGANKPVVAALNGLAAGSGYQVALLCDIRVAHPGVRMGQPEVSSGIPSVTGMYLSERALGTSRMLDLMLTGRLMEIDELVNVGLVHHVCPEHEVLEKACAVAGQLAEQPSVAVALTKDRYRQTVLPGLRDAFAAAVDIDQRAWRSGQPQEVMREFFEARAASKR